jgi:hypothetical protein
MAEDTNPLISAFQAAANATAPAPEPAPSLVPEIPSAAPPSQEAPPAQPVEPTAFDNPIDALYKKYSEQPEADKYPDPDALKNETPEARARWGELRGELKTYQTKAQELESKVAEYEAKLADTNKLSVTPELENKVKTYEQKVAEYERELSIARVEATTEYKQAVTEPSAEIFEAVSAIAGAYQIDEEQNAMLSELLDGVSERDRARVYRLADDMGMVVAKDREIREKASTAWEEVQAREQAVKESAERQRLLSFKTETENVFDLFGEKKINSLGFDLNSLKEQALKVDLDRVDAKTKAYAAAAGTMLPEAIKAITSRDSRIRELEATIARMTRSTPGADAGAASTAAPVTNPVSSFLFGS